MDMAATSVSVDVHNCSVVNTAQRMQVSAAEQAFSPSHFFLEEKSLIFKVALYIHLLLFLMYLFRDCYPKNLSLV